MGLTYSVAEAVATITFDRPEAVNAISLEMFSQLGAVLAVAAADPAVRCVVLRGAGGNFSSGADIKEPIPPADELLAEPVDRHPTYLLRQMEKPTVSAIRGYCLGGALELALATDIRIAARSSTLGFAEIEWALTTGWGGAVLLDELIGRGQALRLLLTAARIDATEAHRLGLIEELVEDDDFEKRVQDIAADLAGRPVQAVKGFKRLLAPSDFAERLQEERRAFAAVAGTPEAQALLKTFGRSSGG